MRRNALSAPDKKHSTGGFVLLTPHRVRRNALSAPTLCTRTTGYDDHNLVVMDDVYAYMQAREKKAKQKAKAECMCGGNTHEESGHGNMDAFPYACTV